MMMGEEQAIKLCICIYSLYIITLSCWLTVSSNSIFCILRHATQPTVTSMRRNLYSGRTPVAAVLVGNHLPFTYGIDPWLLIHRFRGKQTPFTYIHWHWTTVHYSCRAMFLGSCIQSDIRWLIGMSWYCRGYNLSLTANLMGRDTFDRYVACEDIRTLLWGL